MKKHGKPSWGELVICKITKIHPNSAFAELIEYKMSGMIHVSEVALKWVRNIRDFLKENQYVVCRVMRIDGDSISLSVKRVRREDADRRLNEFKRENKAEKMLELAGKKLKKSLSEAYEEVGYRLQEEFGSLVKAFEFALKNPELLKSKGIPKNWTDVLTEIAKKSFSENIYEVKAKLNLVCYQSDGIDVIKRVLSGAEGDGLEVKYISAPEYMLVGRGKNYKEIETKIRNAAENIVNEVKKQKGECSFEIIEK
ncbi:MAG: S1 RNA-binding domain-containing protein [Candidatus Aenigmarchaeota archaeon]|nr:S1 RNA-binding domain-containing protein [Candidatus Aenigmarchaeota archaeon]